MEKAKDLEAEPEEPEPSSEEEGEFKCECGRWSCVRCRTRGLKFASKAQKRALECFGGDSEEPKEQKVEPKQEKADGAGPESLLSQECDDED